MASGKTWNPETYQPLAVAVRTRPRRDTEQRLPRCHYGDRCLRRPHCIYRHEGPERAGSPLPAAAVPSRPAAVCLAFLVGECHFGSHCCRPHPGSPDECAEVRAALRRRPCRNPRPCPFGERCLFRCDANGAPTPTAGA